MAQLTPAQRSAAAKKAAATRKRNLAKAAAAGKQNPAQKGVSRWGKFWAWLKQWWWKLLLIALAIWLVFAFVFPLARIGWQRYNAWLTGVNASAAESPAVAEPAVQPVVVTSSDCLDRAAQIGAPINSAICTTPTSGSPAARVQSGSQVGFGTITFDSETRVWILQNFIVPSYANYSFDYAGREQSVLNAPFVIGSELNPVNNQPFTICWDVTSDGCVPPIEIEFFQ